MATLTFTAIKNFNPVEVEKLTLTADDKLTLPQGIPFIILENPTGGSVDAVFTGQGAPITKDFAGYGQATFENLTVTVDANTSKAVYLTSFQNMLQGEVTLTADGLLAYVFTA